jgi:CRP-like cAMP-binding protein
VSHAARIRAVLGGVFRNPELRRVELAFAGFNAAEWGVWIAMLVYAYEQGGATTAGLVAAAQLVPAGLAAPFAAVLADRFFPARVLALGYVAQALAMGATAAALLAQGPPLLAYALAAVGATCVTVTRPTQSALVPALARTPDELTATNVVSGWIEAVSVLAAPAGAGVLLAVASPGWVFAVLAAVALLAALTVAPVHGPPPAAEPRPPLEEALAGFRLLAKEPAARTLVGLLSAQFIAIGALDVLYVVLAISVLDLGGSGAGYLNAAFGAGGVAGIAITVALIGRRRLMPALVLGIAVWGAAFALLGAWPTTIGALLLLAAAGAGRSLLDVAGRTILQRTAPGDVLSRVFGVLEGLSMAGLALGSLLTPALVGLFGARWAIAGIGALLPLAVLLASRHLLEIDRRAPVPVVEIALLRSLPLFSPLGAPALEGLARGLAELQVPAGTAVIREGEPGDRFYVVADGELEVTAAGRELRTLGRGEGFGEIALLENVPRTATVTARTESRLYALDKPSFLASVSSHPRAAGEAERLVRERLPSKQATIAP